MIKRSVGMLEGGVQNLDSAKASGNGGVRHQ
jgi:hypothetical protein